LSRMGCVHPFVFSRVLALAELKSLEKRGKRITEDLVYVAGPGTFYIEGIKEIIESDECFVKHEGDPSTGRKGCIEYRCPPPSIPEEDKAFLDEAIEEAKNLSMEELNNRVINHPLYRKLVREG
jgi:hydroxypyruvate isomerase